LLLRVIIIFFLYLGNELTNEETFPPKCDTSTSPAYALLSNIWDYIEKAAQPTAN
jgi:hypothetical protein